MQRHYRTRSHREKWTKTTFSLPASDYSKLEALATCSSMSIRDVLDWIVSEACQNLIQDHTHAIPPITEPCIRKSYGISMKAKQHVEALASSLGCTRNQLIHTILNKQCQVITQYLQELPHQHITNARKLIAMCDQMSAIYEQPEYTKAREALFNSSEFKDCDTLLGHVEQLYGLIEKLQVFIQKQQRIATMERTETACSFSQH